MTVTGLTLSGRRGRQLALSATTATTTAAITALTVTPSIVVANKVYDGTAGATVTSCTLSGVLGGDVVSCTGTAAFDSAAVGTGKTVTVSGLALSGAAAGNYALACDDGDDDGGHHRGDGDAEDRRGQQGLRRPAGARSPAAR